VPPVRVDEVGQVDIRVLVVETPGVPPVVPGSTNKVLASRYGINSTIGNNNTSTSQPHTSMDSTPASDGLLKHDTTTTIDTRNIDVGLPEKSNDNRHKLG
jgi:hypothetical protein